ncbi:MAG TPA: hypothetical protein VOA78_08815 [Candidatus Dormibacteraeota bacterium]|nr:hypothetical protein [Candidatus Dormibacteraeota bacterium]
MSKHVGALSLSVLLAATLSAQDPMAPADRLNDLKPLVVTSLPKPDSVIAVPPLTTVRFALMDNKAMPAPKNATDLPKWLDQQALLNSLESSNVRPWHIVIFYDQFDGDGDNFNSGTLEEFWVRPNSYKRIYTSWEFNQTEVATDKGLFRRGDQRWPKPAELRVRAEVVSPFSYADTLKGFYARDFERTFSGHTFQCTAVEKDSQLSDPTQYCFEPGTPILRYSHGDTWIQTVYNHIFQFQGRNLAREVEVTDGGKPYLKLRVETIELIPNADTLDLTPPPDAVGPLGDRISGVSVRPIKMSSPKWPASLRNQHFRVIVEIVIGKNGHVLSAHGISGPPDAYKGCEDSVREWLFPPYLVTGRPVEVEMKIECSNN